MSRCWRRCSGCRRRRHGRAPRLLRSTLLAGARDQAYQLADRRIRALVASGRRDEAVRLCTSYQPGGSNYLFDGYDQALAALIGINTGAYDASVAADLNGLRWWRWLPAAGAVLVVILLVPGVRPRLAEYR